MVMQGANSMAGEMCRQLEDFLSRNLDNPRLGWPRQVLKHRHRQQCCDLDGRTGEELCGMVERRLVNCRRSSVTAAAQSTVHAARG